MFKIFKKENKKGFAEALKVVIPTVLILVVVGILISFSGLVQSKVGSQMASDTMEYNSTLSSKAGLKAISDFQPTWGIIIGIGVVVLILLSAFGVFMYQRAQ